MYKNRSDSGPNVSLIFLNSFCLKKKITQIGGWDLEVTQEQ